MVALNGITFSFLVILASAEGRPKAVGLASNYGTNSCEGRCDDPLDSNNPCQCNSACVRFGDCCDDYSETCLGSSGGNNDDLNLSTIGDVLWEADVDRVGSGDVIYYLQGSTTTSATSDEAANTLFANSANVYEFLLNKDIYSTFINLLDNYERNTGRVEHLSNEEWREIDAFLDAVVASGPMQKAAEYLCAKGHFDCNNEAIKEKLQSLWFDLYPRSGKTGAVVDSSGFEHVFVGETKSTSVTGFHNWVQFLLQELNGSLDYKGYITKKEPIALNTRLTWHGLKKKQASFFIHTSPAFDMAMYTVCFLEKPGQGCSVNLQNQALTIQTYDVGHKSGLQVATAFVAI